MAYQRQEKPRGSASDRLFDIKSKTHDALEKVKEDIRQGRRINVDKAADWVLRNSGIKENSKEWLKERPDVKQKLESAILSQTAEGRKFDRFAKQKGLAGAKKLSKQPKAVKELKAKVEQALGKGTFKTLVVSLFGFFGLKLDKGLGKVFAKLLGIGKKKKKPEKPQATASRTPAQTPAQKEAAKKAAEKQKKYVDMFKAKGLTLRTPEITMDLENLGKKGIKEADISALLDTAMKAGGNLDQVLKAIKEAVPNKTFELRLADLFYQHKSMTPEKLKRVVAAIKDKDSKVPKNLTAIRTFLDKANNDFDAAMKEYEKPKTA